MRRHIINGLGENQTTDVTLDDMKNKNNPNPNAIHPIAGYDKEIYAKPTITNLNIIVGDFTYIADSEFESHVPIYMNGMMINKGLRPNDDLLFLTANGRSLSDFIR